MIDPQIDIARWNDFSGDEIMLIQDSLTMYDCSERRDGMRKHLIEELFVLIREAMQARAKQR